MASDSKASVDQGLVVLITNNSLEWRAGSQVYIEDLCIYLIQEGHIPLVYSTRHGDFSKSLESKGVLIANDLANITLRPDIIHGHHHLDVACALTAFPDTPCVAFCHGVIPWDEHPFPDIVRIYKYIAVGTPAMIRLQANGIKADKIIILPNFVSSWKFSSTDPCKLSRDLEPPSVLMFGNYRQAATDIVAEICRDMKVRLELRGGGYGKVEDSPKDLFDSSSLVFAYGKSAMEALYSGCDVILSSSTGIGELVTDENFSYLRERNFGYTVSSRKPSRNELKSMITKVLRFQKARKRCLSNENRAALASDYVLPRLLSIYIEAIEAHKARISDTRTEEYLALSTYFRYLQISRFNELDDLSRNESLKTETSPKLNLSYWRVLRRMFRRSVSVALNFQPLDACRRLYANRKKPKTS